MVARDGLPGVSFHVLILILSIAACWVIVVGALLLGWHRMVKLRKRNDPGPQNR